jgi:hypothetical protein
MDKLSNNPILQEVFNIFLQIIFGQYLLHRGEDHGMIPTSQWCSRPNGSFTGSNVIKQLSYDSLALFCYNSLYQRLQGQFWLNVIFSG